MPNLGNAWHLPGFGEPRGFGGMRDPIGAIVAGIPVTIITGNQFQGPGNPGNQLQVGSSISFRRAAWADALSPEVADRLEEVIVRIPVVTGRKWFS